MKLLEKIRNREACIGIVGLGYVGLPLILEFLEEKFTAIGFDIDTAKVEMLNAGKSYIKHIPEDKIKRISENGSFRATSDFSQLKEVDCILVCVPTPLNKYREPDISYIVNTAETISKNIRKEQLIVLESSTYPGTTEEVMRPILEKSGLKCHEDFYLAFSPEPAAKEQKDAYYKSSVVAVCHKEGQGQLISAWMCIQNMALAATAEGLGAIPSTFGGEHQEAVEKILGLPEDMKLGTVMLIGVQEGYPGPFADIERRQDFSWLHRNKYGTAA